MINDIIPLEKEKLPYDMQILDKCNLFSSFEIRNIRKTRTDFDYKISNSNKNARSYLEYIAYERGLLLQVNEKRRATEGQDLALKESKKLVEQLIITKIIKLYKDTLAQFQTEERIYENFFKFCKISKHFSEAMPYMLKFLEIHGDKPHVWILAGLWEYEEMKNPQKAWVVFMKGLSRHPKSTEIYKTFIKVQLQEISFKLSTTAEFSSSESLQSMAMQKILDLYNHSKKDIFDLHFLVDLLEILEDYNFSFTVQNEIVRDLTDLFPGHELMWHTLAQRELKGYHINNSFKPSFDLPVVTVNNNNISPESGMLTPKPDMDTNLIPYPYTKLTLKKRIELCAKIYYKAAQIIKTQTMWTYYINAMIDLNKDASTQAKLKYKCLLTAFKSAHESSALTENQYIQYIGSLKRSVDPDESEHLLLAVLERATTMYSTSVNLWLMYLKYFMKQNNELKVQEKFNVAVKKCGRDSIPLWNLLKQYLFITTSIEDKKKVETFFQEAIKQVEPIASYFKVEYIKWISFTRGVDRARQIFYSLKSPSYQLYKKMLEINKQLVVHKIIEEQIEDENFKETRKCYELSLAEFGKSKTELWIDYIKFEKDFGDVKQMNVLATKAKLQLSSIYLDEFLSQYDLLNLMY